MLEQSSQKTQNSLNRRDDSQQPFKRKLRSKIRRFLFSFFKFVMLLARMWEVALPHLYDWALNLNNVCLQTQEPDPTVTVRQSPGWRGEAERAEPWPRNRNAEARRGEPDGRSGTEERERRRYTKGVEGGGRSRGLAKGEAGTRQSRSGGGGRAGKNRQVAGGRKGRGWRHRSARPRRGWRRTGRLCRAGGALEAGPSPGGRSPGLPGAPCAGVPDAVLPLPFSLLLPLDPRPQRVLCPRRGCADPARPDPSGLDHPVGSDADVRRQRRLSPWGAASGPRCARDPAPGKSRPGYQGPHASRPGGLGGDPRVRDRLWSHS